MKLPRLWPASVRVGMCADRLVVRGAVQPLAGDPLDALRDLAPNARITVTLSSDFVRYSVLPWSASLKGEADWLAYARHAFASVYGASAAGNWDLRVARASSRQPRLASAMDLRLAEALRSMPRVVSIQPYLMAAFNARHRAIGHRCAWFVVQERGYLTYALINKGAWRVVRRRRVGEDWQACLPWFLDRESAALTETPCHTVYLFGELEAPSHLGAYKVVDVTLPSGADPSLKAFAMSLH